MKIEKLLRPVSCLAFCALMVFLTACGAGFQAGTDIARGRQALFELNYQGALDYFQSATQTDPNYIFGTELREGTLSFVGRAQYLTGQLAPARDTLQKALAQDAGDNLARLYLGLTLARLNDRQAGLRDIDAGLKGIRDFLNYITTNFANSFGQFWDPNRDIRRAIDNSLTMLSRESFDWPELISDVEAIAMKFEREQDLARLQERSLFQMNDPGR